MLIMKGETEMEMRRWIIGFFIGFVWCATLAVFCGLHNYWLPMGFSIAGAIVWSAGIFFYYDLRRMRSKKEQPEGCQTFSHG
jgi:multisubunit Na+/H+ antiporter MnhE subunit